MESIVGNGTFNKSFATTFLAIPSEIVRFRNEFAKILVAHNIRSAMFHACEVEFRAIDESYGCMSKSITHTHTIP